MNNCCMLQSFTVGILKFYAVSLCGFLFLFFHVPYADNLVCATACLPVCTSPKTKHARDRRDGLNSKGSQGRDIFRLTISRI